jgi:hypothetical protein
MGVHRQVDGDEDRHGYALITARTVYLLLLLLCQPNEYCRNNESRGIAGLLAVRGKRAWAMRRPVQD